MKTGYDQVLHIKENLNTMVEIGMYPLNELY